MNIGHPPSEIKNWKNTNFCYDPRKPKPMAVQIAYPNNPDVCFFSIDWICQKMLHEEL
jgi:hypothetical protein